MSALRTEIVVDPGDLSKSRKPFWAKCAACAHCWAVAYLPMDLATFARIGKDARCPNCGSRKSFVAKQDDGVLQEDGA